MLDTLANAGINAVIGIGTVFLILILISLIIYCFNIFPYIEKKLKKESSPADVVSVSNDMASPGEIAKDDVPVAVIMAAITAYEESKGLAGYSGNGFFVRSIKRRR